MLWELMFANFHWKNFTLLEFYILRLLVLKKFIMLEDVCSMTYSGQTRFINRNFESVV